MNNRKTISGQVIFQNKAVSVIELLVIVLVVGVIGAGAMVYMRSLDQNDPDVPPTPTTTLGQPTATPNPNPTSDWETYTGDYYSFKYPPTWSLEGHSGGYNGATNDLVTLYSPTGNTSLEISVGGTPFGFLGNSDDWIINTDKQLEITLGDSDYLVWEKTVKLTEDSPTKTYGVLQATEHTVSIQGEDVPIVFIFGTGYPAKSRLDTPSYEQYLLDRPTIIQIIETFQLIPQSAPTSTTEILN